MFLWYITLPLHFAFIFVLCDCNDHVIGMGVGNDDVAYMFLSSLWLVGVDDEDEMRSLFWSFLVYIYI